MSGDLFQAFWQDLPVPPGASKPPLPEYEVECLMRDQVTLVAGRTNRVVHQGGVVILTSHRIIWHCPTQARAYQGHLSKVAAARKSRNFFKPSSRVHVYLQGQEDAHKGEGDPATKIDFVHGGRDEFLDQIKYLLQMRDWEKVSAAAATATAGGATPGGGGSEPAADPVFTTRKAGVGGIIRQQEHTRAAQDKLAAEAFSDLQALMSKAREVVGVIERYATVLAAKTGGGETGGKGEGKASAADAELQGLLLDMGISNPVTRLSAGSLYHQELARQLADFLTKSKAKNGPGLLAGRGGMMTLHDAFCLFNRARGTALISPEDLLDASKLLGSLSLGMQMRRFPSGVNVIEARDFSEEKVCARLRVLAEEEADGSLTALDVATHLRVSITLAQEFLQTAESRGLLCRDESVQGTLFYPNRFPEFEKSLPTSLAR